MIALGGSEAQAGVLPIMQGVQQNAHFALLQATEDLPKEIQEQQKTGMDVLKDWILSQIEMKKEEYEKSNYKSGFIALLIY